MHAIAHAAVTFLLARPSGPRVTTSTAALNTSPAHHPPPRKTLPPFTPSLPTHARGCIDPVASITHQPAGARPPQTRTTAARRRIRSCQVLAHGHTDSGLVTTTRSTPVKTGCRGTQHGGRRRPRPRSLLPGSDWMAIPPKRTGNRGPTSWAPWPRGSPPDPIRDPSTPPPKASHGILHLMARCSSLLARSTSCTLTDVASLSTLAWSRAWVSDDAYRRTSAGCGARDSESDASRRGR